MLLQVLQNFLLRQARYADGAQPALQPTALPRSRKARKAMQQEAQAWLTRGLQLIDAGHLEQAEQVLGECLRRDGDNALALSNLAGITLEKDPEGALRLMRRAEKLVPRDASVQVNLGAALQELSRLEQARACYARALVLDPAHLPARNNLAQLDLAAGRYHAASWDMLRARWMYAKFTSRHLLPGLRYLSDHDLPEGREPRERILVHMEQGLGDEIFAAGCLDELRPHAAAIVLACEPRLARLFSDAFPGITIVPRESGWPEVVRAFAPQSQVYAGDLPYWFRRGSGSFPAPRAYLRADPARAARWRERLAALDDGATLKVGISWRGGTAGTGRSERSIPLWEWAPLFTLPGVRWIDLQYGDHRAELQAAQGAGVPITRFEEAIADYDETAALVSELDLVISVTTAVVDLAGALDKPCWVLTPRRVIWKFGLQGERTPWYPALRLFRKGAHEPWSGVLGRTADALAAQPMLRAAQMARQREKRLGEIA